MTIEDNKIVSLIGKRNKSVDDIGFINNVFHKRYNKKKNQIKKAVKLAKANVYGWQ